MKIWILMIETVELQGGERRWLNLNTINEGPTWIIKNRGMKGKEMVPFLVAS